MRKLMVLAVMALVVSLFALGGGQVQAGDPWYVATTGNDANDCLSPATACLTIQSAIGKASSGDTVLVAPGTYHKNVSMKSGVSIHGAGADVTTIDVGGATPVVGIFDSSDVTVSGFTIANGRRGIWVQRSSRVTITNNVIRDIIYVGTGAAVLNAHSSQVTIDSNVLTGNNIGITTQQSIDITIANNVITGNDRMAIYSQPNSVVTITNNVITANANGIYNSRYDSYYIVATIANNVITSNGFGVWDYGGVSSTMSHNDVWGNSQWNYRGVSPGPGDISADPLFADPVSGDYHLQAGSPCVDAGTNDAPALPDTDFDGNLRILDGDGDGVAIVDMGAYELVLDSEGPITSNVVAAPNPVAVGTAVALTANVDDSTTGGSDIASAEYSVDAGPFVAMSASDGAFDTPTEAAEAALGSFDTPDVHTLCVRGTDAAGNTSTEECAFLAVYDPAAGFVTGGGWIDSPAGAYAPDPSLTGRATFGFVSKYKKGAETPTGNTEFQFHAAGLNFHSESYQWLVVTGSDYAKFKGVGTINGMGEYKFKLWAGDSEPDTFRIKIWTEDEFGVETVVYDNGMDQAIGGGSIVVHKAK